MIFKVRLESLTYVTNSPHEKVLILPPVKRVFFVTFAAFVVEIPDRPSAPAASEPGSSFDSARIDGSPLHLRKQILARGRCALGRRLCLAVTWTVRTGAVTPGGKLGENRDRILLRRFQIELWDTTVSGWTTIGENFMRLLLVTLCCFVAPPIVRADPTEDAAIKAIKQLHGKGRTKWQSR